MVRGRALRALLGLALTSAGCWGDGDDPSPAPLDDCVDLDGDGWGVGGACLGDDCDDYNPSRNRLCTADCTADPSDFGCPCRGGAVHCYDGPSGTDLVGPCHEGRRLCDEGRWGACAGQVLPTDEALDWPNGVDDDCDGAVDVLGRQDCWTTGGEAPPGPSGDPTCPFQCNDPAAPDFRIVGLDPTAPVGLTHPILVYGIWQALEGTDSVWLLDTEPDGGFRTGQGRCEPEAPWRCWFTPDAWATAAGAWRYEATAGTFLLPASGSIDVTLAFTFPVGGGGGSCLFEALLPLREVTLQGMTSHDGDCIGERTNDWEPSEWEHDGVLNARITVAEAMAIDVGPCMDMTLCDWLSGQGHRGGCAELDSAWWPNPPDTDLDGAPAWTVAASFAAIGVDMGAAR